jgi:hypothetical protein
MGNFQVATGTYISEVILPPDYILPIINQMASSGKNPEVKIIACYQQR